MVDDSAQASEIIQKEAIVSGVINAVINGIIGWFMFQGKATIPQKFLGSILVTPLIAAIFLGLIAGIAAWFINAAVMKAMLRSE